MANSRLHDDLVNEVEPVEDTKVSVSALVNAIADRIEACGGDKVKLTDLKTVLRENPSAVARAVLANTPDAKIKTRTTSGYDAPSPAFERPREGVRQGMASADDKRDQVSPETDRTEAERDRIRREETAKARGAALVVEKPLPEVPAAEKKADDEAKRKTKDLQHGKRHG